jgi:hypothetical protein
MSSPSTIDVLNRLQILHSRSLPMYLSYAQPYALNEHPRFKEVLESIVASQQAMTERIATFILENHGTVDPGEFPMTFTGYHDLSVDFLRKLVTDRQRKEIVYIEKCVELLKLSPFAQALAQESLGEAKAHLLSLEELAAPAKASA